MGFFSKCCCKTNLPVLAQLGGADDLYTKVVVLYPNGDTISGSYDGYGNVCGADLVDDWGKVKFVLKAFYNGEKYEDLPKSHDDPGQGFFHNMDKVTEWYAAGGFPTHEAYRQAYFKEEQETA